MLEVVVAVIVGLLMVAGILIMLGPSTGKHECRRCSSRRSRERWRRPD